MRMARSRYAGSRYFSQVSAARGRGRRSPPRARSPRSSTPSPSRRSVVRDRRAVLRAHLIASSTEGQPDRNTMRRFPLPLPSSRCTASRSTRRAFDILNRTALATHTSEARLGSSMAVIYAASRAVRARRVRDAGESMRRARRVLVAIVLASAWWATMGNAQGSGRQAGHGDRRHVWNGSSMFDPGVLASGSGHQLQGLHVRQTSSRRGGGDPEQGASGGGRRVVRLSPDATKITLRLRKVIKCTTARSQPPTTSRPRALRGFAPDEARRAPAHRRQDRQPEVDRSLFTAVGR
jgi:hypothetical protein